MKKKIQDKRNIIGQICVALLFLKGVDQKVNMYAAHAIEWDQSILLCILQHANVLYMTHKENQLKTKVNWLCRDMAHMKKLEQSLAVPSNLRFKIQIYLTIKTYKW